MSMVTSLAKGGYVFGTIGLSVREQHNSNSCQQVAMKFYGEVRDGARKD